MAAAWLPNQLGITDEDTRATIAGAECLACCYTVDLCCTVPFMWEVEEGDNRRNLSLFIFYELCWPCMRVARAVGLMNDAEIRAVPRSLGLHAFPSPSQ